MASGRCGGMSKEVYRSFLKHYELTQSEAAWLLGNEAPRSGRRWALENGPPFAVALLINAIVHYDLDLKEIEWLGDSLRKEEEKQYYDLDF